MVGYIFCSLRFCNISAVTFLPVMYHCMCWYFFMLFAWMGLPFLLLLSWRLLGSFLVEVFGHFFLCIALEVGYASFWGV